MAVLALDIAAALLGGAVLASVAHGWAGSPIAVACGVPVWIGLVATNHGYRRRPIGPAREEDRALVVAGLWLLGSVGVVSLAAELEPRRELVGALLLVIAISLVGRVLARWVQRRTWATGRGLHRAVLIGASAGVSANIARLRSEGDHGIAVVGACLSDAAADDIAESGLLTGELADLPAVVEATRPDLVMVLPSSGITGAELRRLAWSLEPAGAELVVCAGIIETVGHRVSVRSVGHAPLFHIASARLSGPSRLVKGAFDRLGAALGLLALAPLLVWVAVAIRRGDGGSPFFRQTRVGRNGREFRILKFRTMVVDAEARKAELAELNQSDAVLFKIADDPRITPIGRVLRRYSIDELPQLWNVLCGEMSLVGPRPPLAVEVAEYSCDMRRRLLVKPGMTGLWQISGRSQLSWAQTETLDVRYVENWSLGLDLRILFRTARAVLAGTGAY